MAEKPKPNEFSVDAIVAQRNKQPYIQLSKNGELIGQFNMAEARNVAHDILIMCSRAEADAMIIKFFEKNQFPEGAVMALMSDFRELRLSLDSEKVEKSVCEPSGDSSFSSSSTEEKFYELMNFLLKEGLELDHIMLDNLKEKFLRNQ